jgi:hypothetical protein
LILVNKSIYLFKSINKPVLFRLKLIDEHIQASKIEMSEEEAIILWPQIKVLGIEED